MGVHRGHISHCLDPEKCVIEGGVFISSLVLYLCWELPPPPGSP